MISSSSRARERRRAPRDGSAPAAWAWTDLRATGPEAEATRREEERQRIAVEEAYRRGYSNGEEAGASSARKELRVAMDATLQVLDEVRANQEAWAGRLEERLVALASAMAYKVMEDVRAEHPETFVALARKAVEAFPTEEALKIRLSPADQTVLVDGGFLDSVIGDRAVRWVPDEDVVSGGCVVEGPDRIVDARIDEALVRIVRELTDV